MPLPMELMYPWYRRRCLPNKGYGNSTTIAFDVDQEDAAKMILLILGGNSLLPDFGQIM